MLKSLRFVQSLVSLMLCMGLTVPSVYADLLALDRCPTPSITRIYHVTDGLAIIAWTASDSATRVDLQWREQGQVDWISIADVQSPFALDVSFACLSYEVRLQAHCNGSDSNFSSIGEFTSDGCCRIPSDLHFIDGSASSATIGWDSVSFAYAHHVRYRALSEDTWTVLETDTNVITISDLMSCTAYEMQVGSQCDLDSTEYSSSLLFQTIECGACTEAVFCSAGGDDSSSEWIDSVSFGAIRFRSGSNQGYLLQNTIQTGIERQREYSFHVSPASTIPDAQFYLRMWIDLNQDGVFTDSTELLVDPDAAITTSGFTQTITLEDSAMLGETRMRIALESVIGLDSIKPSSCGNFLFGEVEDYCISIDDVCPEIQPFIASVTETSAVISWPPVEESIVFIYRYRNVNDVEFLEPELTQDTIIEITGLSKCEAYILQTLSVCVQDTSSWQEFYFESECPNAIEEVLPVAESAYIYPNPFTDHLTLALRPLISDKASVKMITMYGTELFSDNVQLDQLTQQFIQLGNLDALPHGMYLIYLQAGNRRQVFKVIK